MIFPSFELNRKADYGTFKRFYSSSVTYLEFDSGGGGGPASPTCSKGTISFKICIGLIILYIVRTRFESTWKISASSLNIYRISLDLIHISLTFNILL